MTSTAPSPLLLCVPCLLGAAGAQAQGPPEVPPRPLADARAAARAVEPGEIVDTRLAREHDRIVYVFKVVGTGGRRHRLVLDGSTLAVVSEE
ncbi:PepSY domain-containing protein [Salinarimonas soli]|uniref:PepSY domain-containing protein n=1 Tax=Salinarimonas soli TaxID=1638099 RepID=A0A5B2VH65_9HYPH|nr:hypothetical protein [Salinarimonas soli]KAA2237527.1 hypothetical protein F0L46_11110 [Salinarimonas soli]